MSASTPSAEPDRYVAEYLDGPLEGTTEHRYLIEGQPEQRLTQVALVDGTEALFDYVAGETRELNGEQYVQFRFDAKDSDNLQGQADPNEESRHI
ncbi:MAG TPA: hypothetical protein VGC94_04755 [Amnibacterium sp.]|jgi:hypothetical protein